MERECFEDEEVAEKLNNSFVSIKVDREERPDIDSIYMSVCQALTGRGGWPLSIFMTPEQKPFYAGTYFPKHDRYGLPGFLTLLSSISIAWNNKRDQLNETSEQLYEHLNKGSGTDVHLKEYQPTSLESINPDEFSNFARNSIKRAFSGLQSSFDSHFGGFGSSPKFPSPHNLMFLLRYRYAYKETAALEMAEATLDAMYKGGIFDHIGFGFSRYSTDQMWLIPHFEKMLYDNALLAMAYLEAYSATKKEAYKNVAEKIFEYVLRDMTSPEGGFYSAEDADSEGEEGKFYIWTPSEVEAVLGKEGAHEFCNVFGITEKGNFEGKSIPNLIGSDNAESDNAEADKSTGRSLDEPSHELSQVHPIEKMRQKLFEYREKRVHPHKDEKILTAWNGLMIAALAVGGRILNDTKYIRAAEKSADFISNKLIGENGRLMARYKDGEAAYPAYADDYSYLTWGLLELHQSTQKPEYLKKAVYLSKELIRLFWDEKQGGLFLYGTDSEMLISRPKEVYDGAMPSGNSVSAVNFIKLHRLLRDEEFLEYAEKLISAFSSELDEYPSGYCHLLSAVMLLTNPSTETIITAKVRDAAANEMLSLIHSLYNPFSTVILLDRLSPDDFSFLNYYNDYELLQGKTTAYVCSNFACREPVNDPGKLETLYLDL
ncbi:MAG: thioredoxin domain-containing protein [Eubacteriales bacterium]|nr:thioredoxin domain-containing protein [Eubacteriales bacterium]